MHTRILVAAPASYNLGHIRADAETLGAVDVNEVDRGHPDYDCEHERDCDHETVCNHPPVECDCELAEGEVCPGHPCEQPHPCPWPHDPCPEDHGGPAIAFYFHDTPASQAACQAVVDNHDPQPDAPVNPGQATHDALEAEGDLATALGRATCRANGCTECEI